ncbi:unnamed protein product [Rotaria sp. Silwood2]|nr:unnamed protein product [Rotaria sp. Silwood2]
MHKPKNSSSLASSTNGDTAATNDSSNGTTEGTNRNIVLPQRVRQPFQNFRLIWLDANFDGPTNQYRKSIQNLQPIVATITTFTDADQCIDFLSDIENEKIFMIVSGAQGKYVIPEIQECPQLDSIYVFCDNQSIHEQWAKTIPKVKGVYTQIEPICKALQVDCEHCDRDNISISFRGIDPLFMYTQLLNEIFLKIDDDDDKSVTELVEYCRLRGDITKDYIDKVEQEYCLHTPIWWYTAPYFMYSMLNRGLRLMDVDIILKMGFFIRHLHRHIESLHRQQQSYSTNANAPFQVYRALPSNHPDLAVSYLNIGTVYYNMGEYSKALSSYEQSLEIQKVALPPNHPDLGTSYNNIAAVYICMGKYLEGLSFLEVTRNIWETIFPPTHPHIAAIKNNIDIVKKEL